MKLKEILAISGQGGLFKYVAQSGKGIIVESMADGKRSNVPPTARVSSLGEIAIFTEGDDMPLGQVFDKIYAHTAGGQAISHKESPDKIKAFFGAALPGYDEARVHFSDMKKIVNWYNILLGAGMTSFYEPEDEEGGGAGTEPENQ